MLKLFLSVAKASVRTPIIQLFSTLTPEKCVGVKIWNRLWRYLINGLIQIHLLTLSHSFILFVNSLHNAIDPILMRIKSPTINSHGCLVKIPCCNNSYPFLRLVKVGFDMRKSIGKLLFFSSINSPHLLTRHLFCW